MASRGNSAIRTPPITKDILFLSALLALSILLFKEILVGGHLLFGSDFVAFYMGMKQFLFHEIACHRSIPFWNPYIFGGMPFWAHFESTIFYPLNVLFGIASVEKAFGFNVFVHFVLILYAQYLLARTLGMTPSGSFLAAVVYGLSGLVMATLYDGQMYRIQAFAYVPLVLCFLHWSVVRKNWIAYALWGGVVWGIQILAGAPQDAFYTLIAGALFLAFQVGKPDQSLAAPFRVISVLSLLFLTGFGISAIQVIPAFEFIGESVRVAFERYDFMTLGSYPLQGFVTFFMPHFFGRYTKGDFWVSDVPWSIPYYNLYVGILPIFLLFFLARGDIKKFRLLAFAAALAIISLLMAFGSNTPLYGALAVVPGFDRIRAPAKIIVLWAFAMALLAGRGFDDLFTLGRRSLQKRTIIVSCLALFLVFLNILFLFDRGILTKSFSIFILPGAIPEKLMTAGKTILSEFQRLSLFAAVTAVFLGLWYARKIPKALLVIGLLGFVVLDLSYVNKGAVRHNDSIYRWPVEAKKKLDSSIGKDPEIFRVGSFEFGMGPNIEMALGYQTVGGYTPLFLQRYYKYINHYADHTLEEGWIVFFYERHEKHKLMDLLNVKYEIDYSSWTISKRETYLPRAFLVPGAGTVERKEILNQLGNPEFDPTATILFENGDPLPSHLHASAPADAGRSSKITIRTYRPDLIDLEVDSPWEGYLFLSEIFYPGWKASVDGVPKPVLRGNYLFRVIEVPKGAHRIRMVFEPLSIKIGVSVTLVTVLFLSIWFCIFIRRARRSPPQEQKPKG